jgi:hypothetical protein
MWKYRHVLRAKEGEEGGGGGEAVAPEVQAKIDAAVENAVKGLKGKNTELLGKLRESNDTLKKFEGIDPEAVRTMIGQFAEGEEAKLIAEGKIGEVLTKRTERMKSGFEKETAKERAAREAAEARANKFTQKVLENHIRADHGGAGCHKHSVDDAILRASTVFTLNDDGEPIPREGFFGKDGKPLTLKEWFGDMKEKAPHWWPATQGGGANGGGNFTGKKIRQSEFDALSPKERAKKMAEGFEPVPG